MIDSQNDAVWVFWLCDGNLPRFPVLGLVEAQGSGSSSISTGGDRGGLLFLPRRFIHSLILTLLGSPVFSVFAYPFHSLWLPVSEDGR